MIDVNTIGIGVDTREVKSAVTDLDRLGKAADNASRKADGLDDSSKRLEKSTHALSGALGLATRAFGALGVGLLAKEFISASDAMTKMRGQLSNATKSQEEFNAAFSSVRSIANQVQSDLGSIGTVYARLSNALQDMGASQQQVTDVTKTMALALRVNGASAAETSSALLQLSQAFGAGKLSGDEFRSAMESAPNLMRELAKSIGVPIGQLKELAANGQITSDILLKAFSNPELLKSLEAQNEKMKTISGSWQELKNQLVELVGVLNNKTGASDWISEQLSGVSSWLNQIKFTIENGNWFDKLAIMLGYNTKSMAVMNAAQKNNGAPIDFAGIKKFRELSTLESKAGFLEGLPSDGVFYGNNGVTTFGKELSAIRKRINTYKSELGISGNTTIPITDTYMGAPNFAVEKKEGAGGYDARSYKDFKSYEDAAKKQKDLRDKANEQALKDLQDQVTEEFEANEAIYKYKFDKEKDFAEFKKKQEKELNNEVEKHLKAVQRSENKILDEKHKKEKDALEKLSRQQEQMARELSQAFTNGLFDSFKKGESFGKSMIRNLAALAQTWLSRMIEGLFTGSGGIVSTLGGLLGGTVSTSAVAGTANNVLTGTGSNSIFGTLSGIKDFFTGGGMNAAVDGAIQGLAGKLSGWGFDKLGSFLFHNSATLANVLPFAGAALQALTGNVKGAAFTAGGAALGSVIPGVGTIIGGAVGSLVGSLFGGKKLPPRVTQSRVGTYSNGVFSASEGADRGKRKLGASSQLDSLNETFAKTLNTLFGAFDIDTNIISKALLTKKKNTTSVFEANVNGEQLSAYRGKFGKKGTFEQAFQALVENALGQMTVQAIQVSKLPDGIKKFFDGLTKKEDVTGAINALVSLNAALKDLPAVFNQVRDAINTTAYKTSIADLQTLFANTQTYTSLFYTQQEQFDTFTKQLTSQFTELNSTLPATRDGFRSLVDGLMNDFSESGRKQFAGLVALSGAADQYYKQLEAQKNVLNDIASNLSSNYFSTSSDYAVGVAMASNGMDYSSTLGDFASVSRAGDPGLIATVKALVAANADTKALLEAVVKAVQESARIHKIWNGDGLPETRVI